MGNNLNQILWGEGIAFIGGNELFDIQEITINFGLTGIQFPKGDGGANIFIPTGQPLTGRAGFLGVNASMMATLTGGSVAAGTKKRIRGEELTVSSNAVTTSQTSITNTLRVIEKAAGAQPLKQVSSPSADDEYSVSGTTITFNASAFADGTKIKVSYIYADGADGETLTVDPDDLPSNFELYATLRTREDFSQVKGDIIAYFASVDRTGEFGLGGQIGNASVPGFDFNINNSSPGDVEFYYP